MSWQPVAEIQLTKNWQLTEPITGSAFRLKHIVNTNSPQDLRAVVAQVYDESDLLTYFNDKVVTFRAESQGFIFPQIAGILNRKFALKRLDNLADDWTITIEVLDGMPESISLPIAVSEVAGLQAELDGKAAAESVNIHVADIQNPHGVTAGQIGAELAGVGEAAAAEAIALHLFDEDPHPQYATDATVGLIQNAVNTKEAAGAAATAIAIHLTEPDPHSQYATVTQISSLQTAIDGKETTGTTANAIASHTAATDPHSQYATDVQFNQLQTTVNGKQSQSSNLNLLASLTGIGVIQRLNDGEGGEDYFSCSTELLNAIIPDSNGLIQLFNIPLILPIGMMVDYEGTIAGNGILNENGLIWLLCTGATIGNLASGATRYASAKTQVLFEKLWLNSNLGIQDSSGNVATRGVSATVDFNANKRLKIPDLRGRISIMAGVGTGLTNRTWGEMGGTETQTLTAAQLPAHQHGLTNLKSATGGTSPRVLLDGIGTGIAQLTDASGTGTGHNNLQPYYVSAAKLILAGKA